MPSEIPENSRGHKKVYFFLTMYLFLRIPVNIHHNRSDRNQRAAEERGGFYRFTEDHGAEKDAEQDSGVVVDADLGCRGKAVGVGDEDLSKGAEKADQHEQHELAQIRHNEIADHKGQGAEHAEGRKVHDDGDPVNLPFKVAEECVGDSGCDGRKQSDHQRERVRLEARAEYDKRAEDRQRQRRDLDRGKLFLHENGCQQSDKDRGELI